MIKGFEPRLYQETILNTCVGKNALVVLPTGLGKTAIAMMLATQRLSLFPNSKIVFLAPTKPLAEQHLQTFLKSFQIDADKCALFTGDTAPAERAKQWNDLQLIFATPQGIENDVISNSISLQNVSLMIFDEAHRATGDYSYVFLAKQYQKRANFPKILALTASPGAETLKIEEVCQNLFIDAVEVRTPEDPDVKPYVQETEVEWVKLDLPDGFKKIQYYLNSCIKSKLADIKRMGMTKSISFISKRELLELQSDLRQKMTSGEQDPNMWRAISITAEIIKAQHALELLETQCVASLDAYMRKVFEEGRAGKSKAVKNLIEDASFKSAYHHVTQLREQHTEHPKLSALKTIVEEEFAANKFAKLIIFTQYRDTAVGIKDALKHAKGALTEIFVGQAKKKTTGLSQKQQIEMLQQFRDGLFNVLIATSVAEEGLDIPNVDAVVFYEPIPSAIRTIQRRGRTGRHDKGKVIMLMAKGTRDEAFSYSAKHKERQMHQVLKTMQTMTFEPQKTIAAYEQQTVKVYADYREKASGVVKELVELNAELKLEMLQCADYVLSDRVGVEFKLAQDFVDSIVDGRLLEQLKQLKDNYIRPMIIIEGTEDLYALRNVHANAIRGMLATITVSYGIPVLRTKDAKDTAAMLFMIAKREQLEDKRDFSPHTNKKPMTLQESQEYLISCFPNIGLNLAKELLQHLGSVKHIINASLEDLQKVAGVGDKKAQGIKDIVDSDYKK
ncbi:DEAD/DEAH box helicase [Candidatus Woesearchaeota archaeon]|nr:DEAD/DEAH box helicase [Candidatus Woesearchaeota archaeon]